jgi:hypothetical protein
MTLPALRARLAAGEASVTDLRRALEAANARDGLELVTQGAASLSRVRERLEAFLGEYELALSASIRAQLQALQVLMGEVGTRLAALLEPDGSLPPSLSAANGTVDVIGLLDEATAYTFTELVDPGDLDVIRLDTKLELNVDVDHLRQLLIRAGTASFRVTLEAEGTEPEEQEAFEAWLEEVDGSLTITAAPASGAPIDLEGYDAVVALAASLADYGLLVGPIRRTAVLTNALLAETGTLAQWGTRVAAPVALSVVQGYARADAPRHHRSTQARLALGWAVQALREV